MNQFVFRVDSSLKMGTGHVMRCLTLANSLKNKTIKIDFVCRDLSGSLVQYIEQQGFTVHVLERFENLPSPEGNLFHRDWLETTQKQDAYQTKPILEKLKPDWLIVDHYALDIEWQQLLNVYYKKIMVIDDLTDRQHSCDLLLDQNFGSEEDKYRKLTPASCEILCGSYYALLRPEFSKLRIQSLSRRSRKDYKINKILITFGGVDPDNFTGKVLKKLAECSISKNTEVIVIMGHKAPNIQQVRDLANMLPYTVEIKNGVSNIAELMVSADLAIGAAGATSWERCCLGLPTIQMVIAENQQIIADKLSKYNAIKLLEDITELPNLINSAQNWLTEVSNKASEVCDGHGVDRVIERLI